MGTYLEKNEIDIFVNANILNAIDNKLLNYDLKELNIRILDDWKTRKFIIVTSQEKVKPVTFSLDANSFEEHLRALMGATMMLMDYLKKAEDKQIIEVVN